MKRTFTISLFILWSSISYSQTTKDSLSELQSLLDSIPDISLAELGIDTTAEIVPDTLHLVIQSSIASDTAYARSCLNQAIELIKTGKYEDAYAKADTAKHIYQMNIGYVSKEVADCLLQMGRVKGIINSFEIGINYIKISIKINIKINGFTNIQIGDAFYSIGIIYNKKGDIFNLYNYMNKSLIYYLKTYGSRHQIVGQIYYYLALANNSNNDYYSAIKLTHKALNIFIENYGQNDSKVGQAYHILGYLSNIIGEYDKAIEYLEFALDIYSNSVGINSTVVGQIYQNLGISYTFKAEYQIALEYTKKALENQNINLGKQHPNVGMAYQAIGNIYSLLGQYDKAIEYSFINLGIQIFTHGNNNSNVGQVYQNLGSFYTSTEKFDKALFYTQKSIENFKNNIGLSHSYVGLSYQNMGYIYNSIGKYDESVFYSNKALSNFVGSLGEFHPNLGQVYQNLGISYKFKGDFYNGIACSYDAKEIYLKSYGQNHPNLGQALFNLGDMHFSLSNYFEARDLFKNAFQIFSSSFGNIHNYAIMSINGLVSTYKSINQLDSSLYYIHQAVSGIKAQMSSNISAETKNLYQSQNIPVFESAIDVSLIKSRQDQHDSLKLKTYEYTELAKASLLQSQIKQNDALAFAGIPNSLLQKEYDLRIDINWREKQRKGLLEKGKEETDTTVLRISSIIFDLKREQEALFETLEKDYPEYYRLKYDTKTISLEDTQQNLLQKDQTMLEYFVGDSSIFIFVVHPDTFDVVQVKKDFPIDSLVRQMQSGLYGYYGQTPDKRTDVLYKKSINDYTNAAHELYNRIIAPVSHLLSSDLVIIPDGVLGYVPFEALLKSKPEKLNQFGTYPYLINDHTISYNYSATLWQEMKNKKHKKEPNKSLVAFAPFYEGSFTVLDSTINLVFDTLPDGRDTTIFQDIVSRKTYAPLPSSGIEAGTVSKLFKGDYFVNSDATEQKFYDLAGAYRMVHLSTHGVADARQGDYSYLAFAEQKDSIENEFLYVRDIYNTQLNADLVFLSACETAQGELQRGEGIISLARAFAYAGAKSIITTLWQVDDASTKDISIEFYKNLKKGFTKDVALRQAKLRHIKSAKSAQKHPFFWAAMIGIGDMGEVR